MKLEKIFYKKLSLIEILLKVLCHNALQIFFIELLYKIKKNYVRIMFSK